jgi:hypothetical protein
MEVSDRSGRSVQVRLSPANPQQSFNRDFKA